MKVEKKPHKHKRSSSFLRFSSFIKIYDFQTITLSIQRVRERTQARTRKHLNVASKSKVLWSTLTAEAAAHSEPHQTVCSSRNQSSKKKRERKKNV